MDCSGELLASLWLRRLSLFGFKNLIIEDECVSFFLAAGGLNSSRNLETLVSATLLLRAKGALGGVHGGVSAL